MNTTHVSRIRTWSSILVVLLSLWLFGCSTRMAKRGHLMIVGGGLKRENADVFTRMISLPGPGATAGILPTASGVPEETGPDYAKDFLRYGGEGRAEVVFITTKNPDAATSRQMAQQIRKHQILFFTGGDQSRITRVFRPEGKDTICYKAMLDVLNSGGVIAGSSAGAAMMSDPMLRWGVSEEALLIGSSEVDDAGVGIGQGMGFFPYGLTGQHFIRRARFGRMIVALEETKTRYGYGVDNNTALQVSLETGRIEVIGPRGLLLVDIGEAEKQGFDRRNIRLSLMSTGDLIDGNRGERFPAPGKVPLEPAADGLEEIPAEQDPWKRDLIAELIEKLALNPATEAIAANENFELRVSEDFKTSYWANAAGELETLTAFDVRLDIIAREGAQAAAAALRKKVQEKAKAEQKAQEKTSLY